MDYVTLSSKTIPQLKEEFGPRLPARGWKSLKKTELIIYILAKLAPEALAQAADPTVPTPITPTAEAGEPTRPARATPIEAGGAAASAIAAERVERVRGGEEQEHGFFWERDIAQRVYGVTPEEMKSHGYTAAHDIPARMNKLDHCHVSIKVTGNENAIYMADCLRLYDAVSSGEILHLTVIFTDQNTPSTKTVIGIVEIDLTSSTELLFGNVTRTELEALDRAVKTTQFSKNPTKEEKAPLYAILYEMRERTKGALMIDLKISRSNKRLQCHFNKFQKFITFLKENHPERLIDWTEQNEPNAFRGGKITQTIQSRKRNDKSDE